MGKVFYISSIPAKSLKLRNGIFPKICDLPKIHTQGIPLRPTVSSTQSPLNALLKYLKNITSIGINRNQYYIKDFWNFKEKIKNIELPKNRLLISLDVISL